MCGSDQVGGSFFLQSSLFKSQKKSKKVKKSQSMSKHVKKLTLSVICLFLNWLYDGSFSKFQRIILKDDLTWNDCFLYLLSFDSLMI